MKRYSIAAMIAVAVMTASAKDYCFPSAMPPGGKLPSEVKQFASIIWDDNAYSGLSATQYEDKPGSNFASSSFIDGIAPWGSAGKPNTLNLTEGMIGMSWAINTLSGRAVLPPEFVPGGYAPGSKVLYNGKIYTNNASWTGATDVPGGFENGESWNPWRLIGPADTTLKRKNADGTPIQHTFNVISGLFVPIWGQGWESYESKFGYFTPNEAFYADGKVLHTKISVSWGREMAAYTGCNSAADTVTAIANGARQGGQINTVFKSAMKLGHEVGNHTIDHMESNSPLPVKYYEGWNSDRATNGFDYSLKDTMPWGEVIDEAKQFGQKDGNPWQTMGWKINAGKYIAKNTWKGAIELSEDQLKEYLNLDRSNGLGAFRAPRLEVNSNLYFALSDLGYQYDCGLEDGYEANVDGTNFLWPYTLDNGNPNASYQRSIGENVSLDSMPAGLWQIPSNVFIVPPTIRKAVYDHHAEINAAAADGEVIESFEEWDASGGKITGYDFNLYILWGMTKDQWLETMKYAVTLRKNGNKAPIHYGAHTDYYTPIYDNATLQNDINKASYGLNVTKGWNTWKDRISSMEEWIDWSVKEGVNFVTGKRLIEEIKAMQAGEKVGAAGKIADAMWKFEGDPITGETSDITEAVNDVVNAHIKIKKSTDYPEPRYTLYESAGYFEGLDHISLNYQTTSPLRLRLIMANGEWREVTLGSIKNVVNSGKIPLNAFAYDQYSGKKSTDSIDTKQIVGIEVKMDVTGKEDSEEILTIKDLTLYGAKGPDPVALAHSMSTKKGALGITQITPNALSLIVPVAGNYSVAVVGLNGRVVANLANSSLTAGVNKLNLNNLSTGVYLVKVNGVAGNVTLKTVVK